MKAVHANGPLRLAYYGDDFTGSTDALEFLARAGLRAALFIQPPSREQLARYPGLEAVGVAGSTRSMTPSAMEAELRPAFTALRNLGAAHVHYKVCSTFDSSPTIGSIGRAIEIGAEIFQSPFVPLVVGAPALGRYCVFGNLFARMGIGSAGKIHRLDRHPSMSRHPVTPADESDLRRQLARQTKRSVALFDILQVELPIAAAHAALEDVLRGKPDVVLFDVLTTEQLATLGALIDRYARPEAALFSVGSSGIEMALGAHWENASLHGVARPGPSWRNPGAAEPLLVISGSCSPVTAGQIDWAESHGFDTVSLDAPALSAGGSLERSIKNVVTPLRAGRHVVAYTSRGLADGTATDSATLGRALGQITRAALEQTSVRRLVIAGGDSSSHAARALGIEAVEMLAPLAPGAPLCRAYASGSPVDGCEVNFKGGQVGAPDYFGSAVAGQLLPL